MLIAASILNCDFRDLRGEISRLEAAGVDRIHLDIMDGVFVPEITFGPPIVRAVDRLTDLPLDVHLMVRNPHLLLDKFIKAGADRVTIHLECGAPIEETLRAIRNYHKKAGLSVKPDTPAEAIFPYLPLLDQVLIMTVEPGAGGQELMPAQLKKAALLRAEAARLGQAIELQADGGIDMNTAPQVRAAGIDVAVAGMALVAAENPGDVVRAIKIEN